MCTDLLPEGTVIAMTITPLHNCTDRGRLGSRSLAKHRTVDAWTSRRHGFNVWFTRYQRPLSGHRLI
jgi:hypothetical protein